MHASPRCWEPEMFWNMVQLWLAEKAANALIMLAVFAVVGLWMLLSKK